MTLIVPVPPATLYASLVLTHENLVLGKLQFLQGDHVFAVHCRLQGSLVHQVLKVCARETHRAPSDDVGLDGCSEGSQSR